MPHTVSHSRSPDTGLVCLVLVARVLVVAADAGQLRHRLALSGSPATAGDILRAARHLGLKARAVSSHWDRLAKTPLPALARHHDGHWLVIAKADAERVLVQDPLEARPLTLSREREMEERTQLEAEYHHSKKMEAVGQLAGGVAHDFNNILTGILGQSYILKRNFKPGSSLFDGAEAIETMTLRASELTRQLLGFANYAVRSLAKPSSWASSPAQRSGSP